jgi:hypothetical protein
VTPRQAICRKLLRALAGALWSLPFRFVTIPAIVASMVLVAGGPVGAAQLLQPGVMLAGVLASVVLRLLDNLCVEFAVFPALWRMLKGRS